MGYSIEDRQRCIDCYIATTSGYYHLRSALQCALNGLNTHHGHESFGIPNQICVQRRSGQQRTDFSLLQSINQVLLIKFTVYRGEVEVPLIFTRKLANNVDGPLKVRTASRKAGRSHNDRYLGGESLTKHDAKISLYPLAWTTRFAGAQVIRPGIRGSCITAHKIGAISNRAHEALFAKASAKIPCRGNRSYLLCQRSFLSLVLPAIKSVGECARYFEPSVRGPREVINNTGLAASEWSRQSFDSLSRMYTRR